MQWRLVNARTEPVLLENSKTIEGSRNILCLHLEVGILKFLFGVLQVCQFRGHTSSEPKDQVEKTARISTIDSRLIVLPERSGVTLYFVVFPLPENLNVARVKKLDYPYGDSTTRVNLVGTCNGLICLENIDIRIPVKFRAIDFVNPSSKYRSFTLWNPSTGIHRIVADKSNISLKVCGEGRRIDSYCYFGYDHVRDVYHIVRVTNTGEGFILDVYSLKKDSWTKIHNQDQLQKRCVITLESGVFISGTLYLVSEKRNHIIIAFNVATQSFNSFELPFLYDGYLFFRRRPLGELHGRLSVLDYRRNNIIWLLNGDDVDDEEKIKETRWKKIEFERSNPESTIWLIKLLPYSYSGAKQVLGIYNEEHMIWFDLGNKTTRDISVQIPSKSIYLVERDACVCLKTIVSPFIV